MTTVSLLLGFAQVCVPIPDLTPEKQFAFDSVPELASIVSKYQRVRTSFTPEATAYRKLKGEMSATNFTDWPAVQAKFSREYVQQNLGSFKIVLTDILFKSQKTIDDPLKFETCLNIVASASWDKEVQDIALARYAYGSVATAYGFGSPPMFVIRTRTDGETAEKYATYVDYIVSASASYARVEELARQSGLRSRIQKEPATPGVLRERYPVSGVQMMAANVASSLQRDSNPELLDNLRRAFRQLGEDDQRRVIKILKTENFDPSSDK